MEAVKFLAERAGVELPETEYSKEAKERADLKASILEINKIAAQILLCAAKVRKRSAEHYTYLTDRGLDRRDDHRRLGLDILTKYSDDLYNI